MEPVFDNEGRLLELEKLPTFFFFSSWIVGEEGKEEDGQGKVKRGNTK